jgi:hypothetical protein
MATYGEIGFGVRDCKIYSLTTEPATYATGVDVPRIRQVTFNVVRDSEQLEGDDVVVAVQTFAKKLEGNIEAGGINLAVLGILEGGTVGTESGTTPNLTQDYQVKGTDVEKYFGIIAQSIANEGGDIWVRVYKCKATSGPEINFENGAFLLTTCDLEAVFNGSSPSRLYDLVIHETATAPTTTWPGA